jgi:hypothetical protein
MAIKLQGVNFIVTVSFVGTERLFEPFGGAGTNGVFEADTYASDIHIPEILRWNPIGGDPENGFVAAGSNYQNDWYTPKRTINPGDIIVVKDIAWGKLEFFGIKGTPTRPIWIVPENDAIIIHKGIQLTDCEYVFVDGIPEGVTPTLDMPTEAEANAYRFQCQGTVAARPIAIEVYGRCRNITVQGIKGTTVSYGASWKTDPMCDIRYNNGGWNMSNLSLKHFWFEDVSQDGVYWNNSSHMFKTDDPSNGRDIYCFDGVEYDYFNASENHLPMKFDNTELAYGVVTRCGRQGVVAGGLWYGTHSIHHLKLHHLGYELSQSQGEGIGSGGMNRYLRIHDCDIKYTFLYGIADFGNLTWIYNNTIDYTGFLDKAYSFDVLEVYFLQPDTDLSALDSSRADIERVGVTDVIKNIDAGGVAGIAATTKIYYPTTETKTSYIYNNRFGINSRTDSADIQFQDYGPAANWTVNSVVANNTKLDNVTLAVIVRFNYLGSPHPVYSTDIGDVP